MLQNPARQCHLHQLAKLSPCAIFYRLCLPYFELLLMNRMQVLYHRDTGKSRGFAFVTMSAIEDCNAVIENLDGHEFAGQTLRVNISDRPRTKVPLYLETEYKLFVGNLSWSATSESLTKAFQEYGTMVGARVLYDGETGRSRGYGFVCYSTKSEMDVALESLNGFELEGRALRVSLAEGKRS
ncbi:29 kDa ribonucleoprotein A, chloroplastic-like [Pyrus x bretschneideri]|uniref:29 kDa ribonucleoprotein A, chloroplastic-like n=1 Tax=Pyrus x bretschneideri TaxID=225117 RepID=UPI002030776A|nr:29 kDa ribonucleoprotein A, chloroplastic-like [Pyrus x bretschneideri]